MAAGQVPEVKAVATIGAPFDSVNVLKQFKNDIDTIEADGEAEVMLAGRPFKMKKQFIEDAKSQNVADHIERSRNRFW